MPPKVFQTSEGENQRIKKRELNELTCVLYDKTTSTCKVTILHQELFSHKAKLMENIPPTQVCYRQMSSNYFNYHSYMYIGSCFYLASILTELFTNPVQYMDNLPHTPAKLPKP